jgi:glycerol-3-phosphate dehydrogenase (NAD(P)+)
VTNQLNITVIGSGSWGTAFARLLSRKGHRVTVLTLTAEEALELTTRRVNEHFLPGVTIPADITFRAIGEADLEGTELVVYAVPTQATRQVAAWAAPRRPAGSMQLSLAKGLELTTLERPTQIIAEETGAPVAALSGPNHAEEVSRDMPSATVIAAEDQDLARRLQAAITSETFRVYRNDDVVGVEFCGAAKNPIAIAVGMSDGLGFGDNSRASLITRSLAEVTRLGSSLGARFETFAGLAGIGDMIATCTSRHSRNRKAGELLAQGTPPSELERLVGQVVEGIPTTYALHDLSARLGLEMPVTSNVYEALQNGRSALECVRALMGREPTAEDPALEAPRRVW